MSCCSPLDIMKVPLDGVATTRLPSSGKGVGGGGGGHRCNFGGKFQMQYNSPQTSPQDIECGNSVATHWISQGCKGMREGVKGGGRV